MPRRSRRRRRVRRVRHVRRVRSVACGDGHQCNAEAEWRCSGDSERTNRSGGEQQRTHSKRCAPCATKSCPEGTYARGLRLGEQTGHQLWQKCHPARCRSAQSPRCRRDHSVRRITILSHSTFPQLLSTASVGVLGEDANVGSPSTVPTSSTSSSLKMGPTVCVACQSRAPTI